MKVSEFKQLAAHVNLSAGNVKKSALKTFGLG